LDTFNVTATSPQETPKRIKAKSSRCLPIKPKDPKEEVKLAIPGFSLRPVELQANVTPKKEGSAKVTSLKKWWMPPGCFNNP